MTGQFSFSDQDISNLLAEWCRCGTVHMTLGGICLNFRHTDFKAFADKLVRAVGHFENHKEEMGCSTNQSDRGKVLQLFRRGPAIETQD